LDFATGRVHIHYYDEDVRNEDGIEMDAEEIVIKLGYKPGDCQYMCTDALDLQIHPLTLTNET
jgi:hypothetical protein